MICNSPVALWGDRARSYNPDCTTPTGFHAIGLGCSHFARHYSGNRDFLSIPLGTQMFHFPRFPPRTLCVQVRVTGYYPRRVSPFGDPRIIARLRLNEAYRSLPRPSSASGAKASAIRPYYLSGIGMSRIYSFQRPGTYTLAGARCKLHKSSRAKSPENWIVATCLLSVRPSACDWSKYPRSNHRSDELTRLSPAALVTICRCSSGRALLP